MPRACAIWTVFRISSCSTTCTKPGSLACWSPPSSNSQPHGVFATRAPVRPNPIGLSVVKLNGIQENLLTVEGLDILDGTPLLDIKPYIPSFDERSEHRIGWLEGVDGNASTTISDDRFKAP